MQYDVFADALSTIRNARASGQQQCRVSPTSDLLLNVLKLLQEKGYIGVFEYIDDEQGGTFKVNLTTELNTCNAIKPRFHVSKDEYLDYEKRYLPARGFGHLIVSTSQGVMTQDEAENEVGGSLIAYVY